MSYVLADSTGPLEEFASIGGLADFTAWAREMPEPLPSFVRDGYTEDIEQLSSVLADSDDPPPSVIEQFDALRTAAAEAEDILIISDGMSDADLDLEALGDNPGHPFHGNQWTEGEGGDPRPMSDQEQRDIKQWGKQNQRNAALTRSERSAVMEYRRSTAFELNEALRNGTLDQNPELQTIATHLDSAINKSVLDKDVTVYRGVPLDLGVKTGSTFTDKGFSATTFNAEEAALNFAMGPGNKSTVMELEVPKGSRGLYTEGIAPRGYEMNSGREHELLLPRNTSIHITGTKKDGNTTYLTGRVKKFRGAEIETLGGAGSGNFGHAGRPGEIGGSGGGLKVYHGTSEEALRAIRKEGLVPHGSKGGDAWAISIGRGSPDDFLSQTEVNGRRASVFVAEHKETAESFAEYATRMHPGSEAAVIEITIPESEVGRIKEDELSLEKRFEGRIPPTWITKAEVFHPTPERRHDPNYPIADQDSSRYKIFGYDTVADTHKLYFVLLMDGQPATLGGVGSGNFGHSGRPGEVGGSTVAGGTLDNHAALDIAASVPAISQSEREQLIRNVDQLKRSATQAGVPLNKVRILDEHNTFVQGGQQFEELGHYSAKDDEIVFNARPLAAETTQSTEIAFAHENTHREWKEFSDLVGLKSGDPNAASPEARAAVHTLMRDRAQLAKDDGITPYSQAYWRDYQRDLKDANERSIDPDVNKLHTDQANHSFLRATNETLAEISANELKRAFGHAPGSVGSTKSYDPTPIWRTLHSNIKAAVKTRG